MAIKSRENLIGAWAFTLGLIIAILVGFVTSVTRATTNQWILGLLALLGLVVGYFVAEKDVVTFLLASVSVVVVCYAGISGSVFSEVVGNFYIATVLSSVLVSLLFLFIPSTIIVAIKTVFSIAKS